MAFIDTAAHAKYFLRCLELLPAPYASLDTNRLTVAYFCVSGLDMLGAVERVDAKRVIEWIYSLQVLPPSGGAEGAAPGRSAGFRGGAFMGGPFCPDGGASSSEYDEGHLAMTYTALAVLVILKDDLRRIDRAALFRFVRSLQDRHGCFAAYSGGESDMRFLYCATAIWRAVLTMSYLLCHTYYVILTMWHTYYAILTMWHTYYVILTMSYYCVA